MSVFANLHTAFSDEEARVEEIFHRLAERMRIYDIFEEVYARTVFVPDDPVFIQDEV